MLAKAQDYEERIIVDLKGLMAAKILDSDLPVERKATALKYIDKLYIDSIRHAKMLSSWKLKIIGGSENEY